MATTEVSGSRLLEIRGGFIALQQRKLPDSATELRVALMFTKLRPVLEQYLEKLQELQAKAENAASLEEGNLERQRLEREVRLEQLALNREMIEIPVPRRKLTSAHLPPALKTKDGNGERNAEGRAGIIVSLAPEFFELPDDEDLPEGEGDAEDSE